MHSELEKKLLTSFGENGLKCKILTFKNYLYINSTKSFLRYVVNVISKKLHVKKKENKLLKRFRDWLFPSLKLTPLPKATMPDESAFEMALKMARNAIESDFRPSQMVSGGHFVKKRKKKVAY